MTRALPRIRRGAFGWAQARSRAPATLLAAVVCVAGVPVPGGEPPGGGFEKVALPFFRTYCTDCHGGRRKRGGLALDRYTSGDAVVKERKVFEKVLRMLRERQMPPEERKQPTEEERQRVAAFIEARLSEYDCSGQVDPGRVTLRRLNRIEYRNTIRDLTGIDYEPAAEFPGDEVGYGFDVIGDVLALPPLLLEKYLEAAEEIAARAIERDLKAEPGARRILTCDVEKDPAGCTRDILSRFVPKAYRRPLRSGELERLEALASRVRGKGGAIEGLKAALAAVLVSPHFLFRVEEDPEPGKVRSLSGYELATRLSYFLWSTMPDDRLFRLAAEEKLQDEEVLEAEVRRMLEDPRSRALAENFAMQWLGVRALDGASPDPELFPQFDEELREAMKRETIEFFDALVRENGSVLDLIDSDYTYANERLARHYGIEGVKGPEFRRVSLRGTPRGGVLTQAAILTVTSNPNRTSPVKRGKWILEVLLADPPPPPPPNAGELPETEEAILSGSLRERLEKHRRDPNCGVCHNRMDPLGFAFENFDPVGAWREFDGNFPIDPSGELPGGKRFEGPEELRKILLEDRDRFVRALAEKILTYALGRGLEYYDRCAVDSIVDAVKAGGYRIHALLVSAVKTEAFRMRRGAGME